jgi:hypothetical protein
MGSTVFYRTSRLQYICARRIIIFIISILFLSGCMVAPKPQDPYNPYGPTHHMSPRQAQMLSCSKEEIFPELTAILQKTGHEIYETDPQKGYLFCRKPQGLIQKGYYFNVYLLPSISETGTTIIYRCSEFRNNFFQRNYFVACEPCVKKEIIPHLQEHFSKCKP